MKISLKCFSVAILAASALPGYGNARVPVAAPGIEGAAADADQPSTIAADALKAAASGDAVRSFYAKAGWHGMWSDATAAQFDKALAARGQNGLDRVDFGKPGSDGSPAGIEVARTRIALAYASALADGIVDPAGFHDVYTIPRPKADIATGLLQALNDGDVGKYLSGLAPQDQDYQRLADAYVRFAKMQPVQSQTAVADRGTIHAGDRDPRVVDIATGLASNGYLAQNAVPSHSGDMPARYSPALVAAIKRLQADYGIKVDGVIGSDTLAVINIGPAGKARELAVALERRRWLSRNPPATRIDVNTAAATLVYYRDGTLVDQRRVIVGQPGRETPPLRSPIYRLVANPTWTVPKSIPVSAATIRAKNMRRVNGYLVQPPGPDNALGLVKFDMKNDQQIYLHDTSDRSLFDRSQRHLSHGCVRVEDAPGFARMIAEQEGIEAQWQEADQSGEQSFVNLPQPIPVRLLYWNAFVDRDGKVAFRTDPYGWNGAVAKALGFSDGSSRKAKAENIDIGP